MKIPFNKPYLSGNELAYIRQAVESGKISGDGQFTKRCHQHFQEQQGFSKVLLTTSCTDALEMAALLLDIKEGDEVIMPAFTFVSTANAFVLRGAKIVFADSCADNPNLNAAALEPLINSRTRAIVAVHYAGVACDMDALLHLCQKHNLYLVEDAAQAINSYYKGKPLGQIGQLAAFSFHETKNISCGEGGMLAINDPAFAKRAEIIWEKGTNRSAFFRGETDKYGWLEPGSSFLPSDMNAAFLYAQLENLKDIQHRRKAIWNRYWQGLEKLQQQGKISLPHIPDYATNNGHMFYLVCSSLQERTQLISLLRQHEIHAVFHYLPLHQSAYYADKHDGRDLPNAERFADTLVRLPFYYELPEAAQDRIIRLIVDFYA